MCIVSNVGDFYRDRWVPQPGPYTAPYLPYTQPSWPWGGEPPLGPKSWPPKDDKELEEEMQKLKELLQKAKKHDEETGQPDCDNADKFKELRKLHKRIGEVLDELDI